MFYFEFDGCAESGVVVADVAGGDEVFACVSDDRVEVFYCMVGVVEVSDVKGLEFVFCVSGKSRPVGLTVVCVRAFGPALIWGNGGVCYLNW